MSGEKNGKQFSIKRKSLFDHINQITAVQNPNYWDIISEEDKTTYSTYMVNRFLSMKMEWVDFVNEIQKHWNELSPKEHYKIYSSVLPKGKKYLKYIKRKDDMNLPSWFLEVIAKHYECAVREAADYVDTLLLSAQGVLEIREVLTKHGIDPIRWKDLPFDIE